MLDEVENLAEFLAGAAFLHASLVYLSGSIKENVINFQPNPH